MTPISVFIISLNNAHEIERCLQSVSWANEIVVVDSLSTDGTQDICRAHGARVVEQPFLGYSRQLQFAETQCTNDWVLNLYADETVSPRLRSRIQRDFQTDPPFAGLKTPRHTFLHKRLLTSGGFLPSWHLRLFRKSQGGHTDRTLHQKIRVKGPVAKWPEPIDHWCWAHNGELLDNVVAYAHIEAEEDTRNGEKVTWWTFTAPARNFLKRFVLLGGFRQGAVGAVACSRMACEQAIRIMLAWELQHQEFLETPDTHWLAAQVTPELDAEAADTAT